MSQTVCLLVDDEPAIRAYLRAILEKHDIRCLEAGSATEAMKTVTNLSGSLDLVVTDVVMPGDMNGVDLAHWLAASYPRVGVILITGYAAEEQVKRASNTFRLIQKPFQADRIWDAVRQATGTLESGGRPVS